MLKATVLLLTLVSGGLAKDCAFFYTVTDDLRDSAATDARKHCRDDIGGTPEGNYNLNGVGSTVNYCTICRSASGDVRDYELQLNGAGPASVRCGYFKKGTCGDFAA